MKKILRVLLLLKKVKIKVKYYFSYLNTMYYLLQREKNNKLYEYQEAINLVSMYRPKIDAKPKIKNRKNKKDLSIIIPVYNSEKTIKKCIDSIINQSVKYNIEIIAIDDGSTDKSLIILKEYSDKRIIVKHQPNLGAACARNYGINLSCGKYLMFIDADDFIEDGSINALIDTAELENSDIVTGNINKYIEKVDIVISNKNKKINTTNLLKFASITQGAPWGKLYKRSLWNNIRFLEGYNFEDCIIFLDIYINARKFSMIDKDIYDFRSSKNSLFKRSVDDYKCIDSLWGVIAAYEILSKTQLTNEEIQIYTWHLSAILYERTRNIEDEKLLRAIISIGAKFIFDIIGEKNVNEIYSGKKKKMYIYLVKSLRNGSVEKWKRISKTILLSKAI